MSLAIEILRELLSKKYFGLREATTQWRADYCEYCKVENSPFDENPFPHADTCPIKKGYDLIALHDKNIEKLDFSEVYEI